MSNLKTQRTYTLVGHGGSGKTSVAEMLLFHTGVVNRLGKVQEGSTVLDYEPEEVKRAGSVQPGFAKLSYAKNDHFMVDTPGDTNFTGDLPYMIAAADGIVFVIDAVDGVKPLTKRHWTSVAAQNKPSMVVINKMDRDRADFQMAFDGLQQVLGIKPALLYMPIGAKDDFKGLVDILGNKALFFEADGKTKEGEIPDDLASEVESMREVMIENIAESDEELMEKYLEEGELSDEEIQNGLHAGVLSGEVVPVTCSAALENKGGLQILEMIQNLLPSPLEHEPWQGEEDGERKSSPDEPVSAFVFKTIADPFAGHLSIVRVMSGKLASDTTLLNAHTEEKERLGQLIYLTGKNQNPAKGEAGPGSIVALAKLKNTHTGNTLCDEKAPFKYDAPELPNPLISYALAPKEKGDEDKVYAGVSKLLDEDVNLSLNRDAETGDILLGGQGQLHIETAVEKVKRRYKVDIVLKTPKVPYRETFKGKADVQGRHKK